MFESIYSATVTPAQFFLMAGCAILTGLLYSWIMSFRVRANKRFFMVTTLLPLMIATVITFINGNIGAGVAIGGAFGLIRFRSAQGTSDELVAILVAMAAGIAFGMGYLGYGIVITLGSAALYFLIGALTIFEHQSMNREMLLKITIPESLQYSGTFDEIFAHYLKKWEACGTKTTGMGSMFRLSFKIQMIDQKEEKAFIDELRTKNGNLEISVLPHVEDAAQL